MDVGLEVDESLLCFGLSSFQQQDNDGCSPLSANDAVALSVSLVCFSLRLFDAARVKCILHMFNYTSHFVQQVIRKCHKTLFSMTGVSAFHVDNHC